MSDLQTTTGILRTAADITGITGATSFSGSDARGSYNYSSKLNTIAEAGIASSLTLYDETLSDYTRPLSLGQKMYLYDYVVEGSGNLPIREDWLDVSETTLVVSWDEVPIDTAIQVSSNGTTWLNMYFASYDDSSPDGKYYYVWAGGRTSFSTTGGYEVTEVTCKAGNVLGGKYFLIYNTDGDKYFVWFNTDGVSTSPAASGGPLHGVAATGIEVRVLSTDDAVAVALKTKVVMAGQTDFTAIVNPTNTLMVSIANRVQGRTYDSSVGTSGLTISTRTQGGDTESYQYARLPI
jgi:hypothetical protein